VFDYPYPEIARILGKTEAACRQLVLRARRHLREGRPRFDVAQEDAERLADLFFAAVRRGDLEALESALAGDVSLHGDGGGKVPALARPVAGRDRVARVLLSWGQVAAKRGLTIRQTLINGQPGALTLDRAGRVFSVLMLEIGADGIRTIRGVVNPDKLAHLRAV
jgi:RNA polymerase sigma-70 factor (ECF subfamily)